MERELCARLRPILERPTGVSSAGYPYLQREAWEAFRDGIPHLLGMGLRVYRAVEEIGATLVEIPAAEERANLERALKVAQQIVFTAAITAPPDLWLLRHVLGFHAELGLLERLLAGEAIYDLRATAWNSYHAGFKYVHEKSGQGLRPAEPRAPVRLGRPLRAAWSECARRAGYVLASAYCSRTRTIYPYTPRSGRNPSISVNHFFVPADLAAKLGIGDKV